MGETVESGPGAERAVRRERWAGGLSITAGLIHAGLTPSHLAEWWGWGLFFLFASAGQMLYGVALLAGALNPGSWRGDWVAAKANLFLLGILLNGGIIFLYLVTRTVGLPFLGPAAGAIQPVAPIDAVARAVEVGLVALLFLLRRDHLRTHGAPASTKP